MDLPQFWLQLMAGLCGTFVFLICGTLVGWTSPIQIKFQEGANMNLTDSEVGWLINWLALGMLSAPLPVGRAADFYGRRNILSAVSIPFLISWGIVIFAQSKKVLYAGRFIGGLGIGTAFTVGPMYVGEIAEDSIRGALGTLFQVWMNIGILFEYSVGPYVSYETLGVASSIFPVIFISTIIWMPESPYYYAMRRRYRDAEESLLRLRRKQKPEEVADILNMIRYSVNLNAKRKGRIKDLFFKKENRKALLFVSGLVFNQQFSGIMPMLSFMARIFQLSGSSLDASMSAIIIGVVQLIVSIVASLTVDYIGRKPLLLVSTAGCSVTLAALGLYFLLPTDKTFDWIPITSMIFFVVSFVLGLGPVPWAVAAEVFTTDVKFFAMPIICMLTSGLGVTAVLSFNGVSSLTGEYLAFFMFSACCAFGAIWIYLFLPETTGKPLLAIVEELGGEHRGTKPGEQVPEPVERETENILAET